MRSMVILALLLFSTLSWSKPAPEQLKDCTSINHIFLIHGIGGDDTTFGSMGPYLNQLGLCYSAVNFLYDTGNSDLTTYDFANTLDAYIKETLRTNQRSENDKVSLIMHSQGGIVGSLWLHKVKYENEELFKKVDSFITLSTPYWGASIAKRVGKFFYTLPENMDNPISPFGRNELKEMSYGSKTIKNLRTNYFDLFGEKTHIRALAIGGIKRNHSPFIGEDDLAVSAYSSRPDHFYYEGNLSLKEKSEVILHTDFKQSNFIPFIVVRATHSLFDLPGVADISKKCLTEKVCKHPSIKYVTDHLAGKKVTSDNKKFPFKKFRVQLYIEDLQKYNISADDIKIEYRGKFMGRNKNDELDDNGADGTFSFSGAMKSVNEDIVVVTLSIKGHAERSIWARVQGGHLTYIQLKLVD